MAKSLFSFLQCRFYHHGSERPYTFRVLSTTQPTLALNCKYWDEIVGTELGIASNIRH